MNSALTLIPRKLLIPRSHQSSKTSRSAPIRYTADTPHIADVCTEGGRILAALAFLLCLSQIARAQTVMQSGLGNVMSNVITFNGGITFTAGQSKAFAILTTNTGVLTGAAADHHIS